MNKKAKFSGHARRVFFKLLGPSRSKALLSNILSRRYRREIFSFPINVASTKEVLVIIPERPIEILYQFKNILSIVSHFRGSSITVFCETSVSLYIKMIPNIKIIEYFSGEMTSFAAESKEYIAELKDNFDLCILLDRNPDISMLFLVGSINAPIRIGFDSAGEYPFLNLRTRSASKKYIADKNCMIAELFGKQTESLQMSVARKTLDEVDYLIKSSHLSINTGIAGIDILFFLKNFGERWSEDFINQLQQAYQGQIYFYISEKPKNGEVKWLKIQSVPSFSELTPSRVAALIFRSDFVISGNSILYGFASILNLPAIGFFRQEEFELYCPGTENLKGFIYKETPDENCISRVLNSVRSFSLNKNQVHFCPK